MSNQNFDYQYDRDNDVLYLSLGTPRHSYGEDLFDDIIARYDMVTDELTGVTILGFKQRILNKDPSIFYDKQFDVLYMKFSDNSNSYGDEDDYGIVIYRDRKSDEITSITIFDFMSKYQDGRLSSIASPKTINYSDEVIPFIL